MKFNDSYHESTKIRRREFDYFRAPSISSFRGFFCQVALVLVLTNQFDSLRFYRSISRF
jgi:hypothetical protein